MILSRILIGKVHKYRISECNTKNFVIENENPIGIQKGPECGAFSSSFILRHFGQEAYGEELYKQMSYKLRNGGIIPRGVRSILCQHGLSVECYKGSLSDLKNEVSKGNPVIVLIRTHTDKTWLHYVPVVGFDEENIFIAESLEELVNCEERYYNRMVMNSEFEELWDIRSFWKPFCRNLFFVVDNK